VPAGNVYDKYTSRNPVERRMVGGFLGRLEELVGRTGAREAHEIGCGEGELATRLARRGLRIRGSDLSPEVIAEAKRRANAAGLEIEFKAAGVEALLPAEDGAELIICCEVMEHLPDPEAALDTVAALARPWTIISVPREPLWRALNMARGRYVGELGNTPGHLNHWSRRRFVRFLEQRLEVIELRSPLPWTMALCRSEKAVSA
jgi:2-polyprenyl-3-methyl-5-hydroxy-6-metoxy-1,4-benzoquinol methylase